MEDRFSIVALALALALASIGCDGLSSPTSPSSSSVPSGTIQIQRVEVSVPTGTTAPVGGDPVLDVTVTVWINVSLPDNERIVVQECFSKEMHILTHSCSREYGMTAGEAMRDNPLKIRNVSSGFGGDVEPTVIRYIHILIYRGHGAPRVWNGDPVPTNALAHKVVEWEMTFM
jgi:hypothetical protein